MRKRPNRHIGRKGFTLVEVIVVLALLAIIAAFATPGIVTYLRNMQQVRQDETVRLLYSAAQNRLTYLSGHDPDGAYTDFRSLFREGTVNVEVPDGTETVTGKGTSTDTDDIGLAIMMKFGENGALTDTPVIMDEGQVASYHFTDTDEAGKNAMAAILGDSGLLNVIDPGEVTVDLDASLRFVLRVSYLHGVLEAPSIYNEANVQIPDSANVMTDQLKMSVNAENGEELIVHVTCSSLAAEYKDQLDAANFHLVMTLTSDSGKSETYDLSNEGWFAPSLTNGVYSADVTLDSLTSGKHFAELFEPAGFVPGEDITATFQLFYDAELESTDTDPKPVIINPSALSSISVNSLFADVRDNGEGKTAYISNGRHLQNLTGANCKDESVTAAVQYGDIDWTKTQDVYGDTFALAPIVNDNIVKFDGANGAQHTISNLLISSTGDAGIFAISGADFANVQLVDPTVSGGNDTGALVGHLNGGSITNCSAYISAEHYDKETELQGYSVTSTSGNAGGLVGYVTGQTEITNSFAALYKVGGETTTVAGGLIGSVSGKTTVSSCYADMRKVIGANAGGFVGGIAKDSDNYSATVSHSYAVTEVLRAVNTAAGFAASNAGEISDAYALVGSVLTGDEDNGCTGAYRFGFAPGAADSESTCYYYAVRDFIADKNVGAGRQMNSIIDLSKEVVKSTGWLCDVALVADGTVKAGDTKTAACSHPYLCDDDDYSYMQDAEGETLAYPAPRIKGDTEKNLPDLDHYGNWPEPALKFKVVFDKCIPEDAVVAPEWNDTLPEYVDYEPGTKIALPVPLKDEEGQLVYTLEGKSYKYLYWCTHDTVSNTVTELTGTEVSFAEENFLEGNLAEEKDGFLVLTIYANWDKKIKVIYNKNCDADLTPPVTKNYMRGAEVTVPTAPEDMDSVFRYVKDGETYLFAGWNSKDAEADKGITEEKYAPGQTFSVEPNTGDDELNLYAVWKRAYQVIYHNNKDADGNEVPVKSVPTPQLCYPGGTITLAAGLTSSKIGDTHTFVEWNEKSDVYGADKGVSHAAKSSYTMPASTTADVYLYAVWEDITYSVRITVELDDQDWTDRTVSLKDASDNTSVQCMYADGVYKNMTDLEAGHTYDVYVEDEKIDGQSVTVIEGVKNYTAEVYYYTVITRHGSGMQSTAQTYSGTPKYTYKQDELKKLPAAVDKNVATDTAVIYRKGSSVKLTATEEKNLTLWVVTATEKDQEETSVWKKGDTAPLTVTAGDSSMNWPLDLTARNEYTIRYLLVGVEEKDKTNPNPTVWAVSKTGDMTATFKVKSMYTMPGNDNVDAVTVSRNGVALVRGTDYTWDSANGKLTIKEGVINDNITVSIDGIPRRYNIYFAKFKEVTPDDIQADFEGNKNIVEEYDSNPPYAAGTWNDKDSVVNGTALGNLSCTIDKDGYVTLIPNPYYSLPDPKTGEPVKVWCFNIDEENNASLSKLTKGAELGEAAYSYSFRDSEEERDSNTGVIVLNQGMISGNYVVIEAVCVPTRYSMTLKLSGAEASEGADSAVFTHWGYYENAASAELVTDKGYSFKLTAQDGYKLPTDILVRMNGRIASIGVDYSYDSTTGKVTINKGVTGDIVLSAVCEEISDTTTVYVYKNSEGWDGLTVKLYQGTTEKTSTAESRDGAYTFNGVSAGTYDVYINGTDTGKDITKVSGNKSSAKVFYYTLKVNEGTGIQSVSIGTGTETEATLLSGSEVTIRAELSAADTHTHFGGWFRDDGRIYLTGKDETFNLRAHLELTAKMENDTLKIVYRDYDEEKGAVKFTGALPDDAPTTHTYGTNTEIPSPTRDGYTFAGWAVAGSNYGTTLTDDIFDTPYTPSADSADGTVGTVEVCAVWEKGNYSVALDTDGGSMNLTGWTGSGSSYTCTYSTGTDKKLPTAKELTKSGKKLIGYLVTDGANSAWPANTVLLPGAEFGSFGKVTLKALWGDVNDVELDVLKNKESWTRHGLNIELRRGRGTADDPLFVYPLTNGSTNSDSYKAYGYGVNAGIYQVYVNGELLMGKKKSFTVTVDTAANTKTTAELNLYTVTYNPGGEAYTGEAPEDGGLYLNGAVYGSEAIVMNNAGDLRLGADGKSGTLIGWKDSKGAAYYAFGSKLTMGNDKAELYPVWMTGKIGIVKAESGTIKDASGSDMNTGEALSDADLPTGTTTLKDGYYIFVSDDFGVKGTTLADWSLNNISTTSSGTFDGLTYYNIPNDALNQVSLSFKELITLNGSWNEDGMTFGDKLLLTYVKNGATAGRAPATKTFEAGANTEATIADPRLSGLKCGDYSFLGWNTKADGSGKMYQSGDRVTMGSSLTLYAQWGYTLEIELGDGGTQKVEMTAGKTYTLPAAPTKEGYTFIGWKLNSEKTVAYQPGYAVQDLPVVDGVAKMVAEWSQDVVKIHYMMNLSETDNTEWRTKDVEKNANAVLLTEVPTGGATAFAFWNTQRNGKGDVYQPGDTISVNTGEITLYAQWSGKVYWVEKKEWYTSLGAAVTAVDTDATYGKKDKQNLVFYDNTEENSEITFNYTTYVTSVGEFEAKWTKGGTKTEGSGGTGSFLTVKAEKKLVLGVKWISDEETEAMSGTLSFNANKNGRVVLLLNSGTTGATLDMFDGITLTKGYLNSSDDSTRRKQDCNGAGVFIRKYSSFNMHGGEISYCVTEGGNADDGNGNPSGGGGGGGGVFIERFAKMVMGDQILIDSENADEYPYSNTTTYYIKDTDPKSVNYNYYIKAYDVTAENYANGDYAIVTGTPKILYCEARGVGNEGAQGTAGGGGDGGGINCANMETDSLLLYSGVVSGCIAHVKGGGVRTDAWGPGGTDGKGGAEVALRIYELEITENKASFGGGIFQWQGKLSIMNSIISGNQAVNYINGQTTDQTRSENRIGCGGGIFIDCYKPEERSVLNLFNGRISGNTAINDGAGIYMDGGQGAHQVGVGYTEMMMENGSVYENTAGQDGGGIYLSECCGSCILNGGNIYGNAAVRNGDDIYLNGTKAGRVGNTKDGDPTSTNATVSGRSTYLLTTVSDLSKHLNQTEEASGKQIEVYSNGAKLGTKILHYAAKVEYNGGNTKGNDQGYNSSEHTITKNNSVLATQQWADAACFHYKVKVNGTSGTTTYDAAIAKFHDTTNDRDYLILAQGYDLSYALNDATESVDGTLPATRRYAEGATITVTELVPAKAFSQFKGWSYNNTDYHAAKSSFTMPAASITLKPGWKEGVHLLYDANAGTDTTVSGVPSDTGYYSGSETEVELIFEPAPTRAGYRFLGWNTNKDAKAAAYTVGKTLDLSKATKTDNTVTLYAVWEKTCTVTYLRNYEAGDASSIEDAHIPTDDSFYKAGDTVTVLFTDENGNTPGYSGHKFLGWSTNPNATVPTYANDKLKAFKADESAVVLYAVWEKRYKVFYYANDGTNDSSGKPTQAAFDQEAYSEGAFVEELKMTFAEDYQAPEGYRFLGWSPEKNTMTPVFKAEDGVAQKFQIGASDYYLYAVWQQLFRVDYYDYDADGRLTLIHSEYAEPDDVVDLSVPFAGALDGAEAVGWALLDDPERAPLDGLIAMKDYSLITVYDDSAWCEVTLDYRYGKSGAPSYGGENITVLAKIGEHHDVSRFEPPKLDGWKFNGWTMSGTAYTDQTITGTTTLTASWTEGYTLTLHNGDDQTPFEAIKTLASDKALTDYRKPSAPTGWTLDGWYTKNADGTCGEKKLTADGKPSETGGLTLNADIDLYAVWTRTAWVKYSGSGLPSVDFAIINTEGTKAMKADSNSAGSPKATDVTKVTASAFTDDGVDYSEYFATIDQNCTWYNSGNKVQNKSYERYLWRNSGLKLSNSKSASTWKWAYSESGSQLYYNYSGSNNSYLYWNGSAFALSDKTAKPIDLYVKKTIYSFDP